MGTDKETERANALHGVAVDYARDHLKRLSNEISGDGFKTNADAIFLMSDALAVMLQLHIVSIAVINKDAARETREMFIKMLANGREWL